ncbi:ribokinase [Ramlibacter alkalitolerans]|uniref:Ribokinase n=1 Tax=Ramlibacter alkalitolerans TaxID=2039631 RepID=A0ABS1JQ40_9BURK|nr:ribokinase [Ramlibacter alkalitolerans]MBL0426372.1 ribokinase [Ramlibacter alkalitolerans]
MTPEIVVFGSMNMDLVVRVPRAPIGGETLQGLSFFTNPGGKGANQAVACARQGARVAMVGCVGADDFGKTLRNALAEDGIAVANVRSVEGSTGVAVVMVDEAGENRITIVPGANDALKADPESLDGQYLLLQCEVPMAEVVAAARIMRARGATVVMNPAPVCQLPDELWSLIDLLVMNEIEAAELSGRPVHDPASAAAAAYSLRRRGPSTAIVTLGSQGVVVADDAGCRHFPALAVKVVDTTAAGDTFIGAMCAARVAGQSTDAAVMHGIQAATLCVTRAGAQASIPRLHELGDVQQAASPSALACP